MIQKGYYQHRDGGIYHVKSVGLSSVDAKTEMVVYDHCFPFEERTWLRPIEEWTEDRFMKIEMAKAHHIMAHENREAFQKQVSENKAKRKGI